MSSVNAFVISDEDDEVDFGAAHEVGLGLDRVDFSINGYPIDENIFPRLAGSVAKGKAVVEEGVEEEEEEAVPSRFGSTSTIILDEDSDEDYIPVEFPSQSASGAGGSSSPPVLQLTYPDVGPVPLETRPWSAPADTGPSVRGRSTNKRRKVASADRSPLGRGAAEENDRLLRLEQQLAESERLRKEMEVRMQEKDAEAKRLQLETAREALETAKRNHAELMQMIANMGMGKAPSGGAEPIHAAATSLMPPTVQIVLQPRDSTQATAMDTIMQESAPNVSASPSHAAPLPVGVPSLPPSPPRCPPPEEEVPGHSSGSPRT